MASIITLIFILGCTVLILGSITALIKIALWNIDTWAQWYTAYQGSRLKPQGSRLKPQGSRLKPQATQQQVADDEKTVLLGAA